MRQAFENRMVDRLRANFPDHGLTSDEPSLRSMIRQGIERAATYDVVYENDVARYLDYMLILSPDFDTNPETSWAGRILRRQGLTGAQRMRRIDDVFVFSRKGCA